MRFIRRNGRIIPIKGEPTQAQKAGIFKKNLAIGAITATTGAVLHSKFSDLSARATFAKQKFLGDAVTAAKSARAAKATGDMAKFSAVKGIAHEAMGVAIVAQRAEKVAKFAASYGKGLAIVGTGMALGSAWGLFSNRKKTK